MESYLDGKDEEMRPDSLWYRADLKDPFFGFGNVPGDNPRGRTPIRGKSVVDKQEAVRAELMRRGAEFDVFG